MKAIEFVTKGIDIDSEYITASTLKIPLEGCGDVIRLVLVQHRTNIEKVLVKSEANFRFEIGCGGIKGKILEKVFGDLGTLPGGFIQGNSNLTPEKANTYNVGFVFNPKFSSPWLSGFSVSVDYYNIKIRNVISTINGLTALAKCYNLDGSNPGYSNSNDQQIPFCK